MSKSVAFSVDFFAVRQKRSLDTFQRFYLSPDWEKCAFIGKLSVLKMNDGSSYMCRGYIKPTLQKNCCLFDDSVELSEKMTVVKVRKVVEITPILSTCYAKKIEVSVIVPSILQRKKFTELPEVMKDLTKKLLKMFVLSNNVEVNLEELDAAGSFGVSRVVIEDLKPVGPGKIVCSSAFHIKRVVTLSRYKQLKKSSDACLAGFQKQYVEMKDFLTFKHQSLRSDLPQILVVGPSGSGKKTFVKHVARNTQALLTTVDVTEILSPVPGQSEKLLRDVFEKAKLLTTEGPVVMLLLRIETIAARPSRLLCQLNSLLDECQSFPRLTIMATATNSRNLHESVTIASRLHHTVYLGLPNEKERTEIWKTLCPRNLAPDDLQDLSRKTSSFSVADITLILKRVDRIGEAAGDDQYLTALHSLIQITEPSVLRGELGFIKTLDSSSHPVGGLNKVKGALEQAIFWPLFYPDLFEKFNLKPTKGVLLFGPPGCAKTSLARTLASSKRITFVAVSAADLYSPFVGESEQTVANLFKMARAAAPTILFIDEIDALVGRRSDLRKNTNERLLTSFLIEMDGIGLTATDTRATLDAQVIVIGATNRPDSLDSAILRPGRLDKLIYVPPPDFDDRLDILRLKNEKVPLSEDIDLEEIARRTELFSGADLGSLSREAALQAMLEFGPNVNEINHNHWMRALEEIKPSLSADQVRWYADFCFAV